MNKQTEAFKQRLITLVIDIIKLQKKLPKSLENSIFFKQIIRSSSSIGANYQEAQFAHTRKDFAQKLSISLKETNETIYWLELIHKANNCLLDILIGETNEIKMILTKITKSIKFNLPSKC